MQLSLSSPSLDSLPLPANPTCDPASCTAEEARLLNASATPGKEATAFDEFLLVDGEKTKPGFLPDGASKKNLPGDFRRPPITVAASKETDPATSAELSAMLAFLATPAVNQPPVEVGLRTDLELNTENAPPQFDATDGENDFPAAAPTTSPVPPRNLSAVVPATVTAAAPTVPITRASTAETLPTPALPIDQAQASANLVATGAVVPATAASMAQPPAITPRGESRNALASLSASRAPKLPGANLAAPSTEIASAKKPAADASSINFLTAAEEEVTNGLAELGIDVAKPSFTMAPAAHALRQSTAIESVAASISGATVPVEIPTAAQPVELAATAARAVEAVLNAVERVTGDRTSVNLEFSVAGNNLEVRVDLRGGAVHATFRTDSPELRAALAQEWSAAGSKMTDASVRMAPPVFTSSTADNSPGFSGENARQQQQQQSAAQSPAERFILGQARGGRASSSSPESGVAPLRPSVSTTRHLHTFA